MIEIRHKITRAMLWTGETLEHAYLVSAKLTGASLKCASLIGANLRRSDLSDADLRHADLRYANLASADLIGTNLGGASLRHADLSYADLSYADLRYAHLDSANLRNADLTGARICWSSHDLLAHILFNAAGDAQTRSFAGLVLISRDWCWKNFDESLTNLALRNWVTKTLTPYAVDEDTPEPLQRAIAARTVAKEAGERT